MGRKGSSTSNWLWWLRKKQVVLVTVAAKNDHLVSDSVDCEWMCRCTYEGAKKPRDKKGDGELMVIHGKYKKGSNFKNNRWQSIK